MSFAPDRLADLLDHGFDTAIDARSPAEFAEDRLPGAVSLPSLDDEERARVGRIYTRESPFRARRTGAALLARNVARYLEGPLADRDGGWRPLVYCWRGGQRSHAFALILREVGWRAETLEGGYRRYRRLVQRLLYDEPMAAPVLLLDGYTGTAKTELLGRVAARGGQVLDLEGMAGHRGSALGSVGDQPAQKRFESRIAAAVARLDPARPVLVEAESAMIGRLNLPPMLFAAMRAAPRIEMRAAPEARARYLARAYADVTADPEDLIRRLGRLRRLRGARQVGEWQEMARAGDFEALALSLIERHYDAAYAKARDRIGGAVEARIEGGALTSEDLDRAADELAQRLLATAPAG